MASTDPPPSPNVPAEDEPGAPDEERIAQAQTVGDALRLAVLALRRMPGAPTPELDAQLLLAHAATSDRVAILAHPERALTREQAQGFAALVARRLRAEPVAYLTGHRAFFGLDLVVDRRALIPRPETELLVEAALADLRARLARPADPPPVVADIGTGSGAIALAIAVCAPSLPRLYATDRSADALALAAENARRLGVAERVTFLRGDLLEPLPVPVDVLLANLPYVPPADAPALPADVRDYEPPGALYGEDDGLGHLRRFFAQAPGHIQPGATVLVEFGAGQAAAVSLLARQALPGARIEIGRDYAGWERFAVIRLPAP